MPMTYGIEETADVTCVGSWLEISTRSSMWRIRPAVVTGVCLDIQHGRDDDGVEHVLGAFISMVLSEMSGIRRIDLWRCVKFDAGKHAHEWSEEDAIAEAEQMLGDLAATIDAATKPKSKAKKVSP